MRRAFGHRIILAGCVVDAMVACGLDSLFAQPRTFKSGVALVPLTVTVTDTAGRYVPDLTVADFAIFEVDAMLDCRDAGKRYLERKDNNGVSLVAQVEDDAAHYEGRDPGPGEDEVA
jgi:hypothetical protein